MVDEALKESGQGWSYDTFLDAKSNLDGNGLFFHGIGGWVGVH